MTEQSRHATPAERRRLTTERKLTTPEPRTTKPMQTPTTIKRTTSQRTSPVVETTQVLSTQKTTDDNTLTDSAVTTEDTTSLMTTTTEQDVQTNPVTTTTPLSTTQSYTSTSTLTSESFDDVTVPEPPTEPSFDSNALNTVPTRRSATRARFDFNDDVLIHGLVIMSDDSQLQWFDRSSATLILGFSEDCVAYTLKVLSYSSRVRQLFFSGTLNNLLGYFHSFLR